MHAPTTLVQISQRRAIEKPTARKILKVLAEKSLLEVTPGTDRRQKWLTLSDKGQALFDEIYSEIGQIQERLIKETSLSTEDIETTMRTLTTIYEQIHSIEEES